MAVGPVFPFSVTGWAGKGRISRIFWICRDLPGPGGSPGLGRSRPAVGRARDQSLSRKGSGPGFPPASGPAAPSGDRRSPPLSQPEAKTDTGTGGIEAPSA